MKASDLFVRALEHEGVEFLFGIPGEENLDLLESLRGSEQIQLILNRHEQAAGFMAATYGRLTGKTGVCLSTLGPGATNFVTSAAYAQLGAMPMLMITGQKPIKSSKQGQFQIVDIVEMMRPLTKYTHQIVSGDSVPSRVREAFRLAEEERPGAVHLELPEDIACEETDTPLFPRDRVRRPIPEEKAIAQAADLIEAAQSPLLLIGAGANRKRTSKMLFNFIRDTGIPFFTTQMGKGVVDERDPLFLGNAALSAHDPLHCAIDRADLIINVGHDVVEKPPFFMEADGLQVIHVNFSSASVDPVYFPQLEVIGDIGNSIWQLLLRINRQKTWDFSYFAKVKEWIDEIRAVGNDDPRISGRAPAAGRRRAASRCPTMASCASTTASIRSGSPSTTAPTSPTPCCWTMLWRRWGPGLPSAMAARLVEPDKKVLAVCGDGGFMMNSQELETAVRLGMNLVVLILRDDGYGMIKWKQADMGFADWGLDYGNPDFRPIRRQLRSARPPHRCHRRVAADAAHLPRRARGAFDRGAG